MKSRSLMIIRTCKCLIRKTHKWTVPLRIRPLLNVYNSSLSCYLVSIVRTYISWKTCISQKIYYAILRRNTTQNHVRRKTKWKLHLIGLQGFAFHVQVPHLNRQVIPGHQVASAVAELDIGDRRDDFRKEGPVAWVLGLFEDCLRRY